MGALSEGAFGWGSGFESYLCRSSKRKFPCFSPLVSHVSRLSGSIFGFGLGNGSVVSFAILSSIVTRGRVCPVSVGSFGQLSSYFGLVGAPGGGGWGGHSKFSRLGRARARAAVGLGRPLLPVSVSVGFLGPLLYGRHDVRSVLHLATRGSCWPFSGSPC